MELILVIKFFSLKNKYNKRKNLKNLNNNGILNSKVKAKSLERDNNYN